MASTYQAILHFMPCIFRRKVTKKNDWFQSELCLMQKPESKQRQGMPLLLWSSLGLQRCPFSAQTEATPSLCKLLNKSRLNTDLQLQGQPSSAWLVPTPFRAVPSVTDVPHGSWPGSPPGPWQDPYGSRTHLSHFAGEVVIRNKARTALQPSWEVFLQHVPEGLSFLPCGMPKGMWEDGEMQSLVGRCKVGGSAGDRGDQAGCSLFHSGNSPWGEGNQGVSRRKLLEKFQNRANKQPNDPASEPSPCPSSIHHHRHFPRQDLQCLAGLSTSSSWISSPHAGHFLPFISQPVCFWAQGGTILPRYSSDIAQHGLLLEQGAPSELSGWRLQINVTILMQSMNSVPFTAMNGCGNPRNEKRFNRKFDKLRGDKSIGSTM